MLTAKEISTTTAQKFYIIIECISIFIKLETRTLNIFLINLNNNPSYKIFTIFVVI